MSQPPTWTRIATVDAIHEEQVRALLDGADIPARFVAVRSAGPPGLVAREQLDVEAQADRAAEARALLESGWAEGEAAAQEAWASAEPPDEPPASFLDRLLAAISPTRWRR